MTTAGTRAAQLWRYGALLLFCGAPLLLLGFAVENLAQASAAHDDAAHQRSTLSQIVAEVAKHRARGGRTAADTATMFLASTSGSLARSELQETTTGLATAAGGQLVEAQFTSTPEQEAAGTVAIQLDLDIDNKGLFDLLWRLESRMPLLDVTDLSARRNDDPNGGAASRTGDLLHVDLTVQGHWKKGTG